VITGASSGFGRAAALAFGRAGARVSLAARGRDALEDTARACRRAGAEALVVTADVGDAAAVDHLADHTVERFGQIDVWVNNAGVILYGRFEDVPAEDFEQVVRTNLLGQVHGARAALRQFRRQGRGVLINMGSVWGSVSSPQVSAYVASKHAVRAFSECLREELRHERDIEVATMLPQAADTPIFAHAGNYTGRQVCPIPPLVTAKAVAGGILAWAREPKRDVTFGRAGRDRRGVPHGGPRPVPQAASAVLRARNVRSRAPAAIPRQPARPERALRPGRRRLGAPPPSAKAARGRRRGPCPAAGRAAGEPTQGPWVTMAAPAVVAPK
jgi:NAD(P)-dependent dehydrogenase (short-subunit alcohol dehydrogenase family)